MSGRAGEPNTLPETASTTGSEPVEELKARLQLTSDSAAEAILGLDSDGTCFYCNPIALSLLGYEASDLLGRRIHELIHHTRPDGSSHPQEECRSFQALVEGTQCHISDEVLWHKDGSSFPAEYWSYPVYQDEKLVGCVVTFLDITQRKNAERALREARFETESFLDVIPSIILVLNADARITRWNYAAEDALGVPESRAFGRRLAECGVKWLDVEAVGQVESQIEKKTGVKHDNLPFEKNGQKRLLGLTGHSMRSLAGGPQGFLLIGTDVTERRFLQVQQSQAQKLEAIGQLAAGIAHEINTPTQYVSDNLTFLKESWQALSGVLSRYQRGIQEVKGLCLPPATLEALKEAKQAADFDYILREVPVAIDQALEGMGRVAKIVRAMKEFSHPDSDERRAVDINKAIETTITVARNEWKYVADVVTRFDPGLPLVPGFAGDFNQVILNLIVNAAHAIGEVVKEGSKGTITVATRCEGGEGEIAISDTGPGIPEAIRSRVFDPFFTTKEVGKGTGQGLALAYAVVVKKHGGRIWFDTEAGKGTTFFIHLPLAPETSEEEK